MRLVQLHYFFAAFSAFLGTFDSAPLLAAFFSFCKALSTCDLAFLGAQRGLASLGIADDVEASPGFAVPSMNQPYVSPN
jgi:hypothetical protein